MSILQPVVLSGGSGTRLWPLSRESYPKQFLSFSGDGRSMLQHTVQRLEGLGAKIFEGQRAGNLLGAEVVVSVRGESTLDALRVNSLVCRGCWTRFLAKAGGNRADPAASFVD